MDQVAHLKLSGSRMKGVPEPAKGELARDADGGPGVELIKH
jgi:hypothetical protein